MMRHKYNAKRVVNEYGKFDSALEFDVYLFLLLQEKIGNIASLKRQVEFEVIPKQYVYKRRELKTKIKYNLRTIRSVSYIADFTYIDNLGNLHVADAKGRKLPEYILKKKALLLTRNIHIEEWSRGKKNSKQFVVDIAYTQNCINGQKTQSLPSVFENVSVK